MVLLLKMNFCQNIFKYLHYASVKTMLVLTEDTGMYCTNRRLNLECEERSASVFCTNFAGCLLIISYFSVLILRYTDEYLFFICLTVYLTPTYSSANSVSEVRSFPFILMIYSSVLLTDNSSNSLVYTHLCVRACVLALYGSFLTALYKAASNRLVCLHCSLSFDPRVCNILWAVKFELVKKTVFFVSNRLLWYSLRLWSVRRLLHFSSV